MVIVPTTLQKRFRVHPSLKQHMLSNVPNRTTFAYSKRGVKFPYIPRGMCQYLKEMGINEKVYAGNCSLSHYIIPGSWINE